MARGICSIVAVYLGLVCSVFAQDSYRLEQMIATRSLFGDNLNGSVIDLMEDRSVGALFGIGLGANAGAFFDELTEAQKQSIIQRAFPDSGAKWQNRTIFVCWEEIQQDTQNDRELVKQAIISSWQSASALIFEGWENTCTDTSEGIHIAIRDEQPHVLALGKNINKLKNGMILNFSYTVTDPDCLTSEDVRHWCIRTSAVHEFGHAIGFSHEQNRPDTESEHPDCYRRHRPDDLMGTDISLTPWDPHSVMNYCNGIFLNNGVLSEFDKAAVQRIYGAA